MGRALAVWVLFCLCVAHAHAAPQKIPAKEIIVPFDEEALIDQMSDGEKAAMMMIIGIAGKTMTASTRKWIGQRGVGSVILFPKNIGSPAEMKSLSNQLHKISRFGPVLITVDQEGGRVRRIRKNVTPLPSAMTLGATSAPSLSYLSGMVAAKELFHLGINVNLAPVLDVYRSQQDALIGTRSFSYSPRKVAQMGKAYIRALQLHGVSATAKHFPGHGEVIGDSHYTLPTSEIGFKRWVRTHLPPFRHAVKEGVHMIMSAHVKFPKMLEEIGAPKSEWHLPATFSPTLIQKILRQRIGFDGVIMTDDLEMQAIRKRWSYGEAAVRTILAGTDLVMIAWGWKAKEEVYQALKKAITEGRIPEKRVRQSLKRIFRVKKEKAMFLNPAHNQQVLKHPLHQHTVSLIRKLGLVSFRNKQPNKSNVFQFRKNQKVSIYSSHWRILNSFKRIIQKSVTPKVLSKSFGQGMNTGNQPGLHIFFLRNKKDALTLRNAWATIQTKAKLNNQTVAVVSMDSPKLLVGFESAHHLLCTFNNDGLSLSSLGLFFTNKLDIPPTLLSLKAFY